MLFGDACGKGTPAALIAALAQGILAGAVKAKAGPASVVAHMNRALCRRGVARRFLTLFYGVMTRDHRLTYCNAGHCRPMLVDGSTVRRLGAGGAPPGLFGDSEYEEESLSIASGDTLVVFSDGVSEAENHEQEFGDARIHEIVAQLPNGRGLGDPGSARERGHRLHARQPSTRRHGRARRAVSGLGRENHHESRRAPG